MEHWAGTALQALVVKRVDQTVWDAVVQIMDAAGGPTEVAIRAFFKHLVGVQKLMLAAAHRKVVLSDVHPDNIGLLGGRCVFIDWELIGDSSGEEHRPPAKRHMMGGMKSFYGGWSWAMGRRRNSMNAWAALVDDLSNLVMPSWWSPLTYLPQEGEMLQRFLRSNAR